MSYLSSSEFVSHGHPDRLADNIAAILIDKIQKKDGPRSHAAVEVFITRDTVIFGGEITTSLAITDDLLRECVVEGYHMSGYLDEMRKYWTKEQVALAGDMRIENRLCPQSPDIALGTTDKGEDSGYNDQGVFFSSSDNSTPTRLGLPMYIAKLIGDTLSRASEDLITTKDGEPAVVLGPDNKVVVTVEMDESGYHPNGPQAIKAITIAVAHNDVPIENVRNYVKDLIKIVIDLHYSDLKTGLSPNCEWVINGTGKFVVHGASSDTSMTGRKISVNHPSAGPVWCNKMIGGGSLVKPWHASDFSLNVLCRFMANVIVKSGLSGYAVVGCGCAIGQTKPQSIFVKSEYENNKLIEDFFIKGAGLKMSPKFLAGLFYMFDANYHYDSIVDNNFFGVPAIQPWENNDLISDYANQLLTYIEYRKEVK